VTGRDDPYVYPGTSVLRNRFGIVDPEKLDKVERRYAIQRSRRGVPIGAFDLAHLRAIHRHLFQDIYDWAGELRTLEISKGGNQFQFRQYIPTGMADVHRRLTRANFLKRLPAGEFAREAGTIMATSTTSIRSGRGMAGPRRNISSNWPSKPDTRWT
jgi:cell filamentation protein